MVARKHNRSPQITSLVPLREYPNAGTKIPTELWRDIIDDWSDRTLACPCKSNVDLVCIAIGDKH